VATSVNHASAIDDVAARPILRSTQLPSPTSGVGDTSRDQHADARSASL